MSHEIVKKLKSENGKITVSSRSSNTWPVYYSERQMEDTAENRERIRQLIIERVWQPTNKRTKFIRSLNITHYFDGTPF